MISQAGQSPLPTPAERARALAHHQPEAVLFCPDVPGHRETPLLCHVHKDAALTVLLPNTTPLPLTLTHGNPGHHPVLVELNDPTPVPLRHWRLRGTLQFSGPVHMLSPTRTRDFTLSLLKHHPDDRLLEVGHTATLIRLDPTTLSIADTDGATTIQRRDYLLAPPDPFCLFESLWVHHLDTAHGDLVQTLTRHLPRQLHRGRLRPLGVDRYGLRLCLETHHTDHAIRLPFSRPAQTTEELMHELNLLFEAQPGHLFPTTAGPH